MRIPLYAISHFSLVAFNILSLIFVSLITVCLSMFLLGFILPGTLCASCTWLTISFPMVGKFSLISSNIFLSSFSLLFWDLYNVNDSTFNVVLEVSSLVVQREKRLPAMQKTRV